MKAGIRNVDLGSGMIIIRIPHGMSTVNLQMERELNNTRRVLSKKYLREISDG
jgi:hypothetical protein